MVRSALCVHNIQLVYIQNNYTHKMRPWEKANILDYGGQIIVPLDFFIAEPGMQFGLACVILSHASRLSHSKNMAAIIWVQFAVWSHKSYRHNNSTIHAHQNGHHAHSATLVTKIPTFICWSSLVVPHISAYGWLQNSTSLWPAVFVRFWAVSIVLNNDNRTKPPVNRRLNF